MSNILSIGCDTHFSFEIDSTLILFSGRETLIQPLIEWFCFVYVGIIVEIDCI